MRKITEKAVAAFLNSKSFRLANTSVHVDETEVRLKLHGNIIATRNLQTGILEITTANWSTPTTKERLRGLPGVNVYTCKHQLYLNGEKWDGSWAVLTSQDWTHSNPIPSSWVLSEDYYGSPAYRAICDYATAN